MRKSLVCAVVLSLSGCTALPVSRLNQIDSETRPSCVKACKQVGMEMSAIVFIGSMGGCVCEPAAKLAASGAAETTPPSQHASAATMGGAVAVVMEEEQRQQQEQRRQQEQASQFKSSGATPGSTPGASPGSHR